MRTIVVRFVLTAVVLTAGAATARGAAKPELTFETDAVVARVKPGAKTAFFGVVREPSGYGPKVSEYAALETDTDGDGVVRYSVAGIGNRDSIWLVVDMSSGESALHGPFMPERRRRALPPAALHGRGNGLSAKVQSGHGLVAIWLVRPDVGAWYQLVEDGTRFDGDRETNGDATGVLKEMRPVGDSPEPPDDLAKRDVIVVVDLFTLKVSDRQVQE